MKTLLTIVVAMFTVAAVAGAEANPPYVVQVKARQVRDGEHGDAICVEARIVENRKDGAVLSAPRLTMLDGTKGQCAILDERKVIPAAPGEPAVLESGLKIDVTKPLGRAEVLIVTTILKDGKVLWADAQWARIEPAQ